jgi:hypothetical protein
VLHFSVFPGPGTVAGSAPADACAKKVRSVGRDRNERFDLPAQPDNGKSSFSFMALRAC